MYRFIISSPALDDIEEAVEWYDGRKEGLGELLLQLIRKKLGIIRQFPERYPKRKGHFRETPLGKFPFVVLYRYNKEKRSIVITRVYNTYRNPNKKYRK